MDIRKSQYETDESMLWVPEDLRGYVVNGREYMSIAVDPIKWIIPGFLPEGFTILAAVPKGGKSTLSLDWAVGVADEEMLLGLPSYTAIRGRTLYIALDDSSINRGQARLSKRTNGKGIPELLTLSTNWRRSNDGGLDDLKRFMDKSPQQVQVVIIDVLQKFLPPYKEDASAYQKLQEYLPPLRELAQEYHIALLGLMHMNKESSSGGDWTSGIYGNTAAQAESDNILGLTIEKDGTRMLRTRGRDVEEGVYSTKYDKGKERITLVDDGYELDDIRANLAKHTYTIQDSSVKDQVRFVLKGLQDCETLASKDIEREMADSFGANSSTVRGCLKELRLSKAIDIQVYEETRRYRLAGCAA